MRREWLEKDYYAVLGVPKDASQQDVRKSYRKLAQKYHPDNNPGDTAAEERFKEVNEANAVLGDPEQRRQYDEVREMGPFVGGPGGTQHIRIEDISDMFGDESPFAGFGGLGDLLSGMRGAGVRRGPAPPRRGRDVTTETRLTFHEAFNGVVTEVPAGDGGTVKVKIPAGVADRAKIKVKGKGQPGPAGGQPGDLYVRVHVADHPLYRREGSNLRIAVPVTYTEAALGAEIDVPTIDGKVTLRIPHGTTGEKTLRVRGQGFTDPDGSRGDLLVSIDVQVPAHLTTEEEKLLRELRELERDRNPRSHLGV